MAADSTTNFFRLFGDVNGDRTVDIFDLNQFAAAFGSRSTEFELPCILRLEQRWGY